MASKEFFEFGEELDIDELNRRAFKSETTPESLVIQIQLILTIYTGS